MGIAYDNALHVALCFENKTRVTPKPVLLSTTIDFFGISNVQAINATATFYGDKKGGY